MDRKRYVLSGVIMTAGLVFAGCGADADDSESRDGEDTTAVVVQPDVTVSPTESASCTYARKRFKIIAESSSDLGTVLRARDMVIAMC